MENFPEFFNSVDIADHSTVSFTPSQLSQLAYERARIVTEVYTAVTDGEESVILELPNRFCREMRKKLTEELYDRFPQLEYYDYPISKHTSLFSSFSSLSSVNNNDLPESLVYRIKFRTT